MSTLNPQSELAQLMARTAQAGELVWIGLRPERRGPVQPVEAAEAEAGRGLVGDHFRGRANSKRQVTLIQAEHLAAVGSFLGGPPADPALARRNLVVRGLNLLGLKDSRFWVGPVLLEYSGLCHPCSRMEENFGPGGYSAMRGHGGITARVIEGGVLRVGDAIRRA